MDGGFPPPSGRLVFMYIMMLVVDVLLELFIFAMRKPFSLSKEINKRVPQGQN